MCASSWIRFRPKRKSILEAGSLSVSRQLWVDMGKGERAQVESSSTLRHTFLTWGFTCLCRPYCLFSYLNYWVTQNIIGQNYTAGKGDEPGTWCGQPDMRDMTLLLINETGPCHSWAPMATSPSIEDKCPHEIWRTTPKQTITPCPDVAWIQGYIYKRRQGIYARPSQGMW